MRDFKSVFWRAPKGSLIRAQAELEVRVRQLWRATVPDRVMRHQIGALARRAVPVLDAAGLTYLALAAVLLLWLAFGPR